MTKFLFQGLWSLLRSALKAQGWKVQHSDYCGLVISMSHLESLWASAPPQHWVIPRPQKILLILSTSSVLGSWDQELSKDHVFIPVIPQMFFVVREEKFSVLGGWPQMAWTTPASDWMILILEIGPRKYESKSHIFLFKSVLCSSLYINKLSLPYSSIWVLRRKERIGFTRFFMAIQFVTSSTSQRNDW